MLILFYYRTYILFCQEGIFPVYKGKVPFELTFTLITLKMMKA